jgi:hypothetical protein
VATPISPIAAALASEAINKKGTPVVITLLSFGFGTTCVSVCDFNSEVKKNNVNIIIKYLI